MQNSNLSTACTFALLMALVTSQKAAAQSAVGAPSSLPDGQLTEVVVTAQRRTEKLQDTPVAVTALTSSLLKQLQINRMEDLTRAAPGLDIQQTTASQSSIAISLRGASEQSGGFATSESPVAIYIDDVYQSRLSAGNLGLGDVEKIEILRGPQGALYGRNSMTGAITISTQQPDGTPVAHAEVTGGTYGEGDVDAGVGGKLADHIGATLSGAFDHKGGWQHDTTLDSTVGATSSAAVRGALGLLDMGPLTAVLRASFFDQYGQGQYYTPIDPNPPFESLPPEFGESRTPLHTIGDNQQSSLSLNAAYDLGAATLRSITAYQDLREKWTLEFSGGLESPPGSTPVAGFLRTNNTRQDQITEELQLSGAAMGSKIHYIGGLFLYREEAYESLADTFGPGVAGPTYVTLLPSLFHTISTSWAGYGQLEWSLTDRLKLIAGLRYTEDHKTFGGQIQNGFAFPGVLASVSTSLSNSVATPKGTIEYKISDDVMTYATVARGYRDGGFNALAIAQPSIFGQPYAPEYVTSYEIGLKTEFWDKRARLNLAAFDEDLTDLQQVVILSDGSTLTQNAAAANIKGLEAEGDVTPATGLNLFVNLALSDDSYGHLAPNSATAQANATRLPLLSRVQSDVGASWRIWPAALKGGSVTFAMDYAYKSSSFTLATDAPGSYVAPSNRVNASATFESADHHWRLKAAGTNILNEEHYFGAYGLIPGLIATRLPDPPAMATISLSYRY